jgi:carbamoylphosphate synthase large subunit
MKKLFRPRIKSRHPSHNVLRGELKLMPFRSYIRFGSSTPSSSNVVEINTVSAIKNSANKLLMKDCFGKNRVLTAEWFTYFNQTVGSDGYGNYFYNMKYAYQQSLDDPEATPIHLNDFPYPIVAKHIYGSRGRGNTLINNAEEFVAWRVDRNLHNYVYEKFHNYNREYRLHVTKDGCFYACRKMLKNGVTENNRWFRNDSNSVWILEENELFNKPSNWDEIEEHSVKALLGVGLDIGACDVKVSSKDSSNFIIIEINSAPSFGDVTLVKYKDMLNSILNSKKNDV